MGHLSKFLSMWGARDELHFKSIRKESVKYFMAFPLMLAFISFEYNYFLPNVYFNGYDTSLLLPLAFSTGSLIILFLGEANFAKVSHIFAIIMVLGFIMRFLPCEIFCTYGSIICWMSAGVCGVGAWLYFCIRLNNAERLIGVLLEIVIVNTYMLFNTTVHNSQITGQLLTGIILAGFALCSLTFQAGKTVPEGLKDPPDERRKENYWGLVYAIAYFIILQLFNEYIGTSMKFSDSVYAVGGLTAVVIALIIQFACKRSSWQIWNVLLLAAAMATILFWFSDVAAVHAGSFFVGIFSYSGDIVLFYTCAGAIKRAYSFRFFKRFLLGFYASLVLVFLLSGFAATLGRYTLLTILSIFIGALFICFTFLSSTLYDKFLAAEWTEDLHRIDMSGLEEKPNQDEFAEKFKSYSLTSREKEVCSLLLEGRTLRQISADIGIGFSTVNTHYKNLYRKLGINSKAELFLVFRIKS